MHPAVTASLNPQLSTRGSHIHPACQPPFAMLWPGLSRRATVNGRLLPVGHSLRRGELSDGVIRLLMPVPPESRRLPARAGVDVLACRAVQGVAGVPVPRLLYRGQRGACRDDGRPMGSGLGWGVSTVVHVDAPLRRPCPRAAGQRSRGSLQLQASPTCIALSRRVSIRIPRCWSVVACLASDHDDWS